MAKVAKPKVGEPYRGRVAALRTRIKRAKLGSLLLTHPSDYYYATGFTGEDSAVLITSRDVHVVSDGRFDEAITKECPWVRRWMRKGTLDEEIANVVKSMKVKQVGIQSRHLSVGAAEVLRKKARGIKFVPAPPLTETLRRIKEPGELRQMRKALRIAEGAFLAMRDSIRIGDTELALAARLEFEMKSRGAEGIAFNTIVAEGPNAAHPHAHPGKRRVRQGSAILVDWGARVGRYCSDLTRLVFIGSIPRRLAAVYDVVLEAQVRAIDAARSGAKLCDVDAVARSYIRDAGFGDRFNHGLGHGLGIDVHEAPRISWQSDDPLAAGEVVTIEPGVYLPGVGGVRIEDDIVVGDGRARVLSSLPKSAESALIRCGGR